MEDTLQKNPLVPILKLDDRKLRQDDVYLFRLEDAVQIKRLQRIEVNRILVTSDNDAYEDRTLALDEGIDFQILGRVLV
jgi:phage repressor protein C with HTH and peptisase S24 domain